MTQAASMARCPSRDANGDEWLNGCNILDSAGIPIPQQVLITAAKGGSANICLVTFQVADGRGNALPGCWPIEFWLSDDPNAGSGLTATSASGAVGVAASGGADIYSKSSKKAGEGQTNTSGQYILSITDTAKTGFVPCCICPGTGKTIVGAQLTAANYD